MKVLFAECGPSEKELLEDPASSAILTYMLLLSRHALRTGEIDCP